MNNKGFTFAELLIVLVVVVILGTTVYQAVQK